MSESLTMSNLKTIHPEYKIVGFEGTSRIYSGNPSLSQIPKILRNAIIPHEGKKFLYVDLKAAEVYILIRWAKCQSLIDVYESGEDLYIYIAQKVMGKETITKEERDTMKIVVLSILYGSEGSSAARALHISEEEAKAMVDKFLYTFPEILAFQATAYAYTVTHGYTQSFYFRPRILKADMANGDASRKRQSINSAIQNTCADCLKICIGKHDPSSDVSFVTTVFDSVLFEVNTSFTHDDALAFLTKFFSPCEPFHFRFEFGMGSSWGEAQENMV